MSKTKNKSNDLVDVHKVYHKFYNWLVKTFGSDLHGEWYEYEVSGENGKGKVLKYRNFNELELNRRLVGYDVISKITRYVNRYCPEIKVISCDDSTYSGSCILLIPHPKHGITIMFIPQCTSIQNTMFLYDDHYELLVKELKNMRKVYK